MSFRITALWVLAFAVVGIARPADAQLIAAPDVEEIEGTIDWVYDYEQAKQQSKETGKPMFVVFRCER